MEQHGLLLAASHEVDAERTPDHPLARVAENERVLSEICALLTASVKAWSRGGDGGNIALDVQLH